MNRRISDYPRGMAVTPAHYAVYLVALTVFLNHFISVTVVTCTGGLFCVLPVTRNKIFAHRGSIAITAFVAITGINALIYGNYRGAGAAVVFAAMMIITFVVREIATKAFYEKILNCFIIGGVYATVGSIVERIIYRNDPGYRCKFLFTNPNFFGATLMIVVFICAYKAACKCRKTWIYYAAAVFNAIGIYLCGSMAIWCVLFIGIFILLVLSHEYRLLAVFLGVVVTVCVAVILLPDIVPRLNELNDTTDNRVTIWKFAIDHIKEAPFFGRGFFSYRFLYDKLSSTTPGIYPATLSHNILLDSLLSHGIVGVALLGIYVAGYLKAVFKCHDGLKRRGQKYFITTFIVAVTVAISCYGLIDTTVIWVQAGSVILLISSGIGVDERKLRHIEHIERTRAILAERDCRG